MTTCFVDACQSRTYPVECADEPSLDNFIDTDRDADSDGGAVFGVLAGGVCRDNSMLHVPLRLLRGELSDEADVSRIPQERQPLQSGLPAGDCG